MCSTLRLQTCVSDLHFDRWVAGELDEHAGQRLHEHIARCSRCHARQASLTGLRSRFESSPLATPGWLDGSRLQRIPRGGRFRSIALASLLVAAGALLALVELPPFLSGLRMKGKPFVSYFVKRGERVVRGSSAEPLQPADRLRFAYTSASPQYLAIFSLDGDAHASVYYPMESLSARIEPGAEVLLPSAIELDDTVGDELIVAMFCDRPFATAPLRAALESERAPPRAQSGCTSHALHVKKRPRAQ